MKKLLMTLALVLASQLAFCQTFDEVANQLKALPQAQYQELNKEVLKLASGGIEDESIKKVFNNLECMKMLVITDADEATRADFIQKASSLKTRYEKIAEESEDGQSVLIFVEKGEDDKTKCIIMAMAADSACQFICFEGDLSLSDLEALGSLNQ